MSDLQKLTIVTISAAIIFGMVLALLGSLKLALARRLHIGEGRVGGLIAALNLALIPMMLFCGVLVDLLGIQFILLLGSIFTALALFSIGVSPTYRRALVSVFIAGLGAAGLCSGAIVLMPHAFFDSGTIENVSPALNLGYVFIALGALITPALVDVLLGFLSFRRAMIFLAVLALVPGILSFVLLNRELMDRMREQMERIYGLRSDQFMVGANVSHLGLAALVFFFYAPLEAAIAVWTTTYLTEHGSDEHEAAWLLSGFWTMFMLSRLLVAFIRADPMYDPWVVALAALAAAAMLGNLASTASGTVGRFGILLLGFSLGPIFPTLIGIIFRDFPERGTAHGVIFAVGSAASLLLGPIMGMRMQKGSQSIFAIPLALSLGLLLSAVVFALIVGKGSAG